MTSAIADWARSGGYGGGFPACARLWAWGVVAGGFFILSKQVGGGDPKIAVLGLIAGGILATTRRTRTAGASIAAVAALFSGIGGVGGIVAGGLVIALASMLSRPDLGMRGLRLALPAYFLVSAARAVEGDWSYVAGLLVIGVLVPSVRAILPWILGAAGVGGGVLGVANPDIFCTVAMVFAWMRRTERAQTRKTASDLPAMSMKIQGALWEPVGGWRTRLVVAGMGWAMYQNWILMAGGNTMWEYAVRAGPASVTVLYALGTSAIFLGCRPGLMLAMASAGLWHLLESWIDAHPKLNFTGEEYLVWFAFPAGLFILSILGRGLAAAVMDNLTSMFCRIMLLGSLGFAVLAKMNTDFFDPQVSCMVLARDIPIWWKVAPGTGEIPAGLLVGAEAAPLVLSFFSGPLAIIAALAFTQGLAAIGPLGINACIIALTLGLLRDTDLKRIWRGRRLIAYGVILFVLFVLPFSQLLYQGPRPWFQFAVFHTVSVAIGLGAAVVLVGRTRAMVESWRMGGIAGIYGEWLSGWKLDMIGVRARWVFFVCLAALLLFNGMCPYLGIKFRGSFAMLANLRVDHDRWNHFFMPRFLLMSKHDPYVRVISVEAGHYSHPNLAKRKRLNADYMYSPEYFARACEARESDGQRTHLTIRWQGAQGILDSEDAESFRALVDRLPRRRDWGDRGLQEVLTFGNRPQHCTH